MAPQGLICGRAAIPRFNATSGLRATRVVPLGVVGGLLDPIGGGGWGAMVTSTSVYSRTCSDRATERPRRLPHRGGIAAAPSRINQLFRTGPVRGLLIRIPLRPPPFAPPTPPQQPASALLCSSVRRTRPQEYSLSRHRPLGWRTTPPPTQKWIKSVGTLRPNTKTKERSKLSRAAVMSCINRK